MLSIAFSVWDLKAAQMNKQNSCQTEELTPYEFELGHNVVEETKIYLLCER